MSIQSFFQFLCMLNSNIMNLIIVCYINFVDWVQFLVLMELFYIVSVLKTKFKNIIFDTFFTNIKQWFAVKNLFKSIFTLIKIFFII